MPAPTNLSFETGGALAGVAASWSLVRVAGGMRWAPYARDAAGDLQHFEDFEFAWGNVPFVGALDGTNTERKFFSAPLDSIPADGFERHWDNDGFLFSMPLAESAEFLYDVIHPTARRARDDFEGSWANEPFYFSAGPSTAATFNTTPIAFDGFELEWVTGYVTDFSGTAMDFEDTTAREDFEAFKEDQVFTVALPSTILAVAHGYVDGDEIVIFSSIDDNDTSGLPTPLNDGLTYTVATASTDSFSITTAGVTVVMTDGGRGTNYIRAKKGWGGRDGDTSGHDP